MLKNKRFKNYTSMVYEHLRNNKKEYIIVSTIFLIGVFLGVIFINNSNEEQLSKITSYFNAFLANLKSNKIDILKLTKTNVIDNIIFGVILWFFGTTVIGIPIVFGLVLYRGFCFGYTISTIIMTIGIQKGILFAFIALCLQNIFFIPAIIAISVSGYKLYKSIIKNKDRENIKLEILRHTLFSTIMIVILTISAIIETMISTNFLIIFNNKI